MTAPIHELVKKSIESADYVPPGPPPVQLARRPVTNAGRKHPAYGAKLLANPPPEWEAVRVLLGWKYAKCEMESQPIVVDSDPALLRFDVVAGRRVRVDHEHNADPRQLLNLAQALIDYGATAVELVIPFPPPGARGSEHLHIVPRLAR
ncbi:hypothetical protein [Thauera mechernichensis]